MFTAKQDLGVDDYFEVTDSMRVKNVLAVLYVLEMLYVLSMIINCFVVFLNWMGNGLNSLMGT